MERTVTIKFTWHRRDKTPIPWSLEAKLEKEAIYEVGTKMDDGYMCGRLRAFIDNVNYIGHWNAVYVDAQELTHPPAKLKKRNKVG